MPGFPQLHQQILPWWYFHTVKGIFSQMREPTRTNELKSYDRGIPVAGMATHTRHILSKVLDKQRYPGPPD
jgi:hypothetical protein